MTDQYCYVDTNNGTNNLNTNGDTPNTGAFATIQYAQDVLIPGNTVSGIEVALPYTINIVGTTSTNQMIDFTTTSGTDNNNRVTVEADRFGAK